VVRRLGGGGMSGGVSAFMAAMQGGEGGAVFPLGDAVKLFADGHEEPIRGATLSGVSVASFKDIVAASRSRTVTTLAGRGLREAGMMMAMVSILPGWLRAAFVPELATYVVPSLLFEDMSIRKPSEDHAVPPAFGPPWSTK